MLALTNSGQSVKFNSYQIFQLYGSPLHQPIVRVFDTLSDVRVCVFSSVCEGSNQSTEAETSAHLPGPPGNMFKSFLFVY